MTVRRVLVQGLVVRPAALAAANGSLRELRLDVEAAGNWSIRSVLLATAEADAEAGDLAEGEAVTFAGFANRPRFPDDPLAHRLTADRALALRRPHGRTAAEVVALPSIVERVAELERAFDDIAVRFVEIGINGERARIAAIMNCPSADGLLALAWKLAEAGMPPAEAECALTVAKYAATFPAIDPGAGLTH